MGRNPRNSGKSILGNGDGIPPVISELNMLASLMKTITVIQTVNDIETVISHFNTILYSITRNTSVTSYSDGLRYLVDDDPFGLQVYQDLDTLTFVLKYLINTLDVLKITMQQKGFKGTGINVSVKVVPSQITLFI